LTPILELPYAEGLALKRKINKKKGLHPPQISRIFTSLTYGKRRFVSLPLTSVLNPTKHKHSVVYPGSSISISSKEPADFGSL